MDERIETGRIREAETAADSQPIAADIDQASADLSTAWPPELFDDFERTVGTFGDVTDEGFGVGLWRHAWLRRAR